MRTVRLVAPLAALLAVAASPGIAHAAAITQSFYADSGDACRYGVTDGALDWRYGATSPLPMLGVNVSGKLIDQPLPSGPVACADDRYYSSATYIAYSGTVEVDRQTRVADNGVTTFAFTLGANAASTGISRVVIQVCRNPIVTLPPSYCGKPATYLAPPVA